MPRTILLGILLAACASSGNEPGQDPNPSTRGANVTGTSVARSKVVRDVKPIKTREKGTAASDAETEYADYAVLASARGEATYYADKFDGRRTASGTVFRNSHMTAAHREYPFGTVVRVTNLKNDRSVIVRVTDRGPNGKSERAQRTIIDLTQRAARELDFIGAGRVAVKVEVLEWGAAARNTSRTPD